MFATFATLFYLSFAVAYAKGPDASFTKTLQRGAIGDEVSGLQKFLKQFPDIYPEGLITGYFGSLTKNAVIRFQIKEGIAAVGIVGPITRARLNELIITKPPTVGLPIRLKIPGINVNAAVQYVGLAPDGSMDVTKGPADVAWFNLGPRPGESGGAVIAGHYGRWKTGEGSVFDDLNKLNNGDRIYVEDEKGEITSFVVRESRSYDPNADASDVFGSSDGKPRLNLITCEGVWDKVSKSFSKRLVIFTEKE